MSTESYIELLEEARAGLKNLIRASEPGHTYVDDWNRAYRRIKQALEYNRKKTEPKPEPEPDPAKEARDQERAERQAREERWNCLHRDVKRRHILETIGDDRLPVREIAKQIETTLGCFLYTDVSGGRQIASLIKEMMLTGELLREKQPIKTRKGVRPIYVYWRAPMPPEVEDLQRRLTEGDVSGD